MKRAFWFDLERDTFRLDGMMEEWKHGDERWVLSECLTPSLRPRRVIVKYTIEEKEWREMLARYPSVRTFFMEIQVFEGDVECPLKLFEIDEKQLGRRVFRSSCKEMISARIYKPKHGHCYIWHTRGPPFEREEDEDSVKIQILAMEPAYICPAVLKAKADLAAETKRAAEERKRLGELEQSEIEFEPESDSSSSSSEDDFEPSPSASPEREREPPSFEVDEIALLNIPARLLQSGEDTQMLVRITKKLGNGRYELMSRFGRLRSNYALQDLERIDEKMQKRYGSVIPTGRPVGQVRYEWLYLKRAVMLMNETSREDQEAKKRKEKEAQKKKKREVADVSVPVLTRKRTFSEVTRDGGWDFSDSEYDGF